MAGPTDREYFMSRAQDCLARARAARDGNVAAVHLELAAAYDKLVAMTLDRPRGRFSDEELAASNAQKRPTLGVDFNR